MSKKSGIVAYVVMAVFLVAFVACSDGTETKADPRSATPDAPTAVPSQPTVVPTQLIVEPTQLPVVAPTQPVVVPTQPVVDPTPPTVVPTIPIDVEVSKVFGTITYLQRIALGRNAVVIVKLLDVSRADAPSITLGEQITQSPGQVPVSFEIEYNPDDIDERFTYTVHAEIREDEKLIFTTTTAYAVITHDNPVEVDLVLEPVAQGDPIPSEFSFGYGFEIDDDGWQTGFADLPVDWPQDLYELEAGYRQLPTGLTGSGIYLQGHNRSDDLFMYLTRQVEGLKPLTEYQVEFRIDLATNVPGGLMGIGGSPGESVFVKGGAATGEPVVADDGTGLLQLNVDKGFQSNDGDEMVNVGNIAHDEVIAEEFRIKTLENSFSPLTATSDENGQLWLIVGTDSGFEGLTGIYYTMIVFDLSEIE